LKYLLWSVVVVLTSWSSLAAQQAPGEGRRVTVRLPSGAQVDVLSRDGTEQGVLQALEEAARQLRAEKGEAPARAAPAPALPASSPEGPLPVPAAPLEEVVHDGHPEPANRCIFLPLTLLWTPPLASQREPRSYLKATSLENDNTFDNVDTAIGVTFPVLRWGRDEVTPQGLQLDFFAVVFSRWSNLRDSVGVDYRFGVPLTFACGPWSGRIAYEHTSTHLGDELAERTGRKKVSSNRDEVVVGLAYSFWDSVRIYGQVGYALGLSSPGNDERRDRYDWGIEWIGREVCHWIGGRPFAAFDMDLRGDQDYTANVTTQIGWRWSNSIHRPALRLALEYYDGRSPYGQFLLDRENWFGVGIMVDY
jgi:hypothetical protein